MISMSYLLAPPVEGVPNSSALALRPAVWTYVAGTTVGGLGLGSALAFVVALLHLASPNVRLSSAVGGVIATAAVLSLYRPDPTALWPYRRMTVPNTWMRWRDFRRTAFAWGTLFGTGVLSP